jgi:hypothetical protein
MRQTAIAIRKALFTISSLLSGRLKIAIAAGKARRCRFLRLSRMYA